MAAHHLVIDTDHCSPFRWVTCSCKCGYELRSRVPGRAFDDWDRGLATAALERHRALAVPSDEGGSDHVCTYECAGAECDRPAPTTAELLDDEGGSE